ncbi:MAG: hypothetical protein EBU08_10735 [Micrococcales bacterium]|nr:hypothetical protein [Micrococcales bacterium]
MLEHVRHGGTPYDARGQHIVEIVEQINVLSQFRRAHQGRVFEGAAGELVAETTEYLNRLRHNLKTVSNDRGYTQYFESWSPADVSESDLIVEDLKSLFVETRIDPRIEQALPMLARIQKEALAMKEAEIFESWANRIVEGTWTLPETPEQQDELKMLMSRPLTVGADGMNATEQLYGLIGDDELFDIIGNIAEENPDANCWDDPRVQDRLEELGVYMVTPAEPAQAAETPPVAEGRPEDLPGIDYDRPGDVKRKQPGGDDDQNPYPYSPEEDDDYFREIFRKKREAAKQQGMAEGNMDGKAADIKGQIAELEAEQEEYEFGSYAYDTVDGELQYLYAKLDKAEKGVAEGLGYSQDPAQAKWYHEGRKAFKGGTTGNLIQDIAKKHGVPSEWIDAFHAGYKDQEGFGKDPVDEGDNMSTFEQAQCNQTMEGEYCPEHGMSECGNYGMYESQLARIKSLALLR